MLLVRCKCGRFFAEGNRECPKCGADWRARGSGAKFYTQFSLYGKVRRVRLRARNLRFAQKQALEIETDREQWWEKRQERKAKEKAKTPTFSEAVPKYLEWSQHQGNGNRGPNRPGTITSKLNSFTNRLGPYLGQKRVDAISDQDIFRFIIQEKGGREPESINLDLRYLKTFLSWCIDRGYCTSNPMSKIRQLETKGPRTDLRFKDWEIGLLMKTLEDERIPAHKRNIVKALMLTGLRAYSEVARAEWSWYDPESETLTIPAERTKGKRPIRKTLSGVMSSLLNHLTFNRNPESRYIFPNPRTGKPYANLKKLTQAMCRGAGIRRWQDISPKWFRHNFLSWGGSLGYSAERLQATVGHADPSTTLHYVHPFDSERRLIEDGIAEKFFGLGSEQESEQTQKERGGQKIPTA